MHDIGYRLDSPVFGRKPVFTLCIARYSRPCCARAVLRRNQEIAKPGVSAWILLIHA